MVEKSLSQLIGGQKSDCIDRLNARTDLGVEWDLPSHIVRSQLAWQRMEQVHRLRTIHKLQFHAIAKIFGFSTVRAKQLSDKFERVLEFNGRCPIEKYFSDPRSLRALVNMIEDIKNRK